MPLARPLPTVIGPTENALRALLTKVLSTTRIKTYPAWVIINAASNADAAAPAGNWQRAAGDLLKVEPGVVAEELARLRADGLVSAVGSPTAVGAAELATARAAVAATTARLVEGISEQDQATTGWVLDHIRRRANELLSRPAREG